MAEYNLTVPVSEEQVRKLKLGDTVYLSGEVVCTVGLPTHQRMVQCIETGKPLPVEVDNVFLHLGGVVLEKNGKKMFTFINPTTSTRFNPYMPAIIRGLNLRVTGGKGGLDRNCLDAMKEVGCVFLSFIGGGSFSLTQGIKAVKAEGWSELIYHYRLVRFVVDKLGPAIVAIDANGNSVYQDIEDGIHKRFPEILKELETPLSTPQK
jgi:fumarate hydratase subunit beta